MPANRMLLTTGGLLAAAGVAGAIALAGSHRADAATVGAGHAAAPRIVTVTARDYAFDAPDTVPAGVTTIRLVNKGPELHHVYMIRLEEGKTMADFMKALQAGGGPPPSWIKDVGGPNAPVPGSESKATLLLTAGRYVITCFIPSADHMPHAMKGMVRELIVTPAVTQTSAADFPASDLTLSLTDYAFGFSEVPEAGKQRILVRNDASQAHEVLIVKLAPGKRAHDFAAWAESPTGPPPGQPVGGTTGIPSHDVNQIEVDLTPGEYGLICFWPDAKDGKPHFLHGMVSEFTIPAK